MQKHWLIWIVAVATLGACDGDSGVETDAGRAGPVFRDSGGPTEPDGGPFRDAAMDGGARDGGSSGADGGLTLDASAGEDGGGRDAGADAGGMTPDAGRTDGGQPDAGRTDAGRPDAGRPDAGRPDAGRPDAGGPDAGQPDAGQPDAGQAGLCTSVSDLAGQQRSDFGPMSDESVADVSAFCGQSCFTAGDRGGCIARCWSDRVGPAISAGCQTCFVASTECVLDSCFLACAFGSAAACARCNCDNCAAAFDACSGLDDALMCN